MDLVYTYRNMECRLIPFGGPSGTGDILIGVLPYKLL